MNRDYSYVFSLELLSLFGKARYAIPRRALLHIPEADQYHAVICVSRRGDNFQVLYFGQWLTN